MVRLLTEEQEKLLKKIYFEDKNYVGRDKLYNLVKTIDGHPSKEQVMYWLKKQETYQLHYKPKKSSSISSIVMKKPNIYYQVDLIDMGENANYGYRYIFTCIDAFSKQAFATPMKKKNETSTLKALQKIHQQIKDKGKSIKVIHTDNGSEFVNQSFDDYLKENNIKHITGIAGRPQAQGIIERFNGIIKDYIMKDKTTTGKNDWVNNLSTFIDNYNNTYHNSIKVTPNEADNNIEKVAHNIKKNAQRNKPTINENLQEGDKVRIKIFKGKLDKSSTQNFSKSIYTIAKVITSSKPFVANKYRIKNSNGEVMKNFYNANDLFEVIGLDKNPINSKSTEKKDKTKPKKPKETPFQTKTRGKKVDYSEFF